jgi:ketosteroid isomerase-like protein
VSQASEPVSLALEAAGIADAKLGTCRGERLSPDERKLYAWILRQFAEESAPSADDVRDEALRLDLDPEQARRKLASEDLIHFDNAGEVTVAYPFSGRPTAHRVVIDGRSVYAMCAIDALGIAPMLGQAIEITSRDPVTAHEINVSLKPDGTATWQPNEAVVVAGRACEGASFQGCCQVLNFFASRESGESYLRERQDVRGPRHLAHRGDRGCALHLRRSSERRLMPAVVHPGCMASELTAIASKGLEAWRRGDFETVERILDPDVEWCWFEPGEWDCHNRDDVMRVLRERYEQGFAKGRLEFHDGGQDALIVVAHPSEIGGAEWPAEVAIVMRFLEGKVVSMQDYPTVAEARYAVPAS